MSDVLQKKFEVSPFERVFTPPVGIELGDCLGEIQNLKNELIALTHVLSSENIEDQKIFFGEFKKNIVQNILFSQSFCSGIQTGRSQESIEKFQGHLANIKIFFQEFESLDVDNPKEIPYFCEAAKDFVPIANEYLASVENLLSQSLDGDSTTGLVEGSDSVKSFEALSVTVPFIEDIEEQIHAHPEEEARLLEKCVKFCCDNLLFSEKFLRHYILNNPLLELQARHDLGNIVTPILGYIELLGTSPELVHDKNIGRNFFDVAKYFIRVVEDLLLRVEDKDIKKREYNYALIKQSILLDKQNRDDSKKYSPALVIQDIAGSKLEGRKPYGIPGLVDNFILNAFRNASREKVHATRMDLGITVDVDEGNGELVYYIQDNGDGIPDTVEVEENGQKETKSFFVPNEEGRIGLFIKGQSGSGSTGLGIADADVRFPQYGMKIAVSTKRLDGSIQQWRSSNALSNAPIPAGKGTIFEIRVPLKSQATLEQQSTPGIVAA